MRARVLHRGPVARARAPSRAHEPHRRARPPPLTRLGPRARATSSYGNTPYDDALREQGEEQPVVRTLLATRGGQIGSHQPSAEATVSNAEETRAAVDASAITASHEVKESVRTVIKWVSQQCSATQKMRKLVDDALTIEREDGAVLSDVRPGFWGALKLYGEGQQERGWHIQETVKPQVDKWSESLSEFAAHITRDLLLKVCASPGPRRAAAHARGALRLRRG